MFAALLREPGVVETLELRSRFGFLALHGGSLERGTAEVARDAAARSGASLYAVLQPEELRWHVPSSLVDPASSRALGRYLEHVEVVVSVHGYGRAGYRQTLLVGGGNRGLAVRAARSLRRALPAYTIVDDVDAIPPGLRGLHPENPVNRVRQGGIQVELPAAVRNGRRHDREALVSALAGLVPGAPS